jgi:hypothetical protein
MKKGVSRIVFLVGKFAIKIPNFTYCHLHFLHGCYANWSERDYCSKFAYYEPVLQKVAKSYFCSWFGLIQIQARCEPNTKELSPQEVEYFKDVCTDIKPENFGYYRGKLVCLDYA